MSRQKQSYILVTLALGPNVGGWLTASHSLQLYRELPSFLECSQYPHSYLDTV